MPFRYGLYRDNVGGYKARDSFIEKVRSALDDCYNYYSNAFRSRTVTLQYQFCEIHLDKKPHLRGCNIGYSGMVVDHVGNVYLCQAKMDREPIGNVNDQNTLLQMVWSQNTFPELCSKDVFDCNGCKSCQWVLICSGGCSITNFGANGSMLSISPYCKLFQSIIPKLIEIQALKLINLYSAKKGGEKSA